LPLWKPENYSQEFYGATPLRVGIEKSRNVMTVRLANAIGMPTVVEYGKKFGIADDMPELLSFSLGAKETTPLRLATAYGMIVNGGRRITPSLIDRVMDRNGKTLWRADKRDCSICQTADWNPAMNPPDIPDDREQVEDERTAYQMTSILQGVVQRGTAAKMAGIGFPLAGKTGTTNESKDAWFAGFTPDLVCVVYVGFDDPKPLGSHETGASVAVPIFQEFISAAMKDKPAIPFRVPSGLRMVRVNPATEELAQPGDKNDIWEAFIPGTEPQEGQARPVLDGSVTGAASEGAAGAMNTTGNTQVGQQPVEPSVQTFAPPAQSLQSQPVQPQQAPASGSLQVPPAHVIPAPSSLPSTSGTGGLY
jgi:penicillin-binding protein 1A